MVTAASPASRVAAGPRDRWRRVPFGLLAAGCAVVALLVAALRPLVDIDVYWHVLVGQQILDGVPVAEAGRGWSAAPVPDTWVSTQWLAEVGFAALFDLDGWTGLLWFRYAGVALVLVVLALTTVRGRSIPAAAVPFGLGACALAGFAQERSQLVTYLLAPVVGALVLRALARGVLPRWWLVLPVVAVWANIHGGWVIAALGCGLVVLGRWLDHGLRDRVAVRALGLTLVVLVAACLTPVGPANLLSSWRFSQAASVLIVEWAPVNPLDAANGGLLWTALLLVWAVSWATGRPRPPRSQVLVVLALLAFGLLAWRNIPVAVLLLAPMLAERLQRTWAPTPRSPGWSSLRWSSLGRSDRAAAAVLVVALVLGGVLVGRSGEIPADQPTALAVAVAALPGDQRVLNDYNTAGVMLFCGRPGQVLVSVDGRTERFGADYLGRYRDLMALRPGWEALLDELSPTAAVLANTSPLVEALVSARGWRQVAATPAGYLLLLPPTPGKAEVAPVQPAARTDASCTAAAAVATSPSSAAAEAAPTTSAHTSASRSST